MNRATLIGTVGRDPKITTFKNGDRAAGFSLATTEKWKDKSGERKEKTEWHNIKVYGGLVDVVEAYVKKGTQLFIEGQIVLVKWEKDGQERQMTEIQLKGFGSNLRIFGGKAEKKEAAPKTDTRDVDAGTASDKIDDDIPF
jgi:single-strand DNA-binding protein